LKKKKREKEKSISPVVRVVGKTAARMIERIVKYLMAPFNADVLETFIDRDKLIFSMLYSQYADYRRNPQKWRPQDARMLRYAIGSLHMCRDVLHRLPMDIVSQYCTVPHIVEWIKDNRPDLCKVILTNKGMIWLTKQVMEVRRWLGLD